jgi:phosphatidylserine/phosphatidylglycerophosphate/cardiolipin synthase-like enzyme
MKYSLRLLVAIAAVLLLPAESVHAADTLCDPSYQSCRDAVIALINNEKVEIDVAFWFMQDARYESAIVNRWKAGVKVRLLVDPRANPSYSGNSAMLTDFANAGIPMRYRTATGILHWKLMLFAGQNTVEFGSANYSPNAFVPNTPYSDYVDETIYETEDPSVVQSFMTKFDDSWTDTTNFRNYANVSGSLTRTYPTYPIDADLNFPPAQSYANRAVSAYSHEKTKIDVIMYRITDQRHTNAILSAHSRGVPIRMIVENNQYHNPQYLWDAWNVDQLYAAGIPLRWRGHNGENHEKLVLLYGQAMTIFGSSNWTSASSDSQQEHNYFTTKSSIFTWFEDQFERMWNNTNPAKATETVPFVPLPPDTPTNESPASGASVSTTTATLKWYPGPWGVLYDVYFGANSAPPLVASNVNLGPSTSTTDFKTWTTPSLTAGTTYYWQIVSRTFAGLTKTGPMWSFTTPSSGGGGGGGGPLPTGWKDADIGAVGTAGGASYSSGTFSVSGAGDDIWDTADAFNYAYKKMSGNGQLVARVASVENTAAWAKAGVMIRNTLNPNSKYALMLVSAGKGLAFQYRATTGGSAAQAAQTSGAAPTWVKIVRAGTMISGYSSSDGSTWTLVGQATVAMNASVFVGLAVSSHTTSAVCEATFDHVE